MKNINASEVNKLRVLTGASMIECKKALEESNGNGFLAYESLCKKKQNTIVKTKEDNSIDSFRSQFKIVADKNKFSSTDLDKVSDKSKQQKSESNENNIMSNQQFFFKGISQQIIIEIKKSKFEILIAVAWLTDKEIITELEKKIKQKIKISIIIYDDKINNKDLFKSLYYSGAQIMLSKNLMHNKICIIDRYTIINGSYNWTYSARSNNENIQITNGNTVLNESFIKEFERLKLNCQEINSHFDNSRENLLETEKLFNSYYNNIAPKDYPYFYCNDNNSIINLLSFKKGIYLITNEIEEKDFFRKKYYTEKKINLHTVNKILEFNAINHKIYEIVSGIRFERNQMAKLYKDKYLVKEFKINNYSLNCVFLINKNGEKISNEIPYKYRLINEKYITNFTEFGNEDYYLIDCNFEKKRLGKNIKFHTDKLIVSYDKYDIKKNFKVFDLDGVLINEFIDYHDCKLIERGIEFIKCPEFKIQENRYNNYFSSNSYQAYNYSFIAEVYAFDERKNLYYLKLNLVRTYEQIIDNDRYWKLYFKVDEKDILYQLYEALLIKSVFLSSRDFIELKNRYLNEAKHITRIDARTNLAFKCIENHFLLIDYMKKKKVEDNKNCYIATLVYEDINHPKVECFRKFRDNVLINCFLGKQFVKFYYRYSPHLVKKIENKTMLNNMIKIILDVILKIIK